MLIHSFFAISVIKSIHIIITDTYARLLFIFFLIRSAWWYHLNILLIRRKRERKKCVPVPKCVHSTRTHNEIFDTITWDNAIVIPNKFKSLFFNTICSVISSCEQQQPQNNIYSIIILICSHSFSSSTFLAVKTINKRDTFFFVILMSRIYVTNSVENLYNIIF